MAVNPDEAWQAMLALAPTWAAVWAEALTVHHPPLLLMLEHPLGGWLLTETGARLWPMLAGALAPVVAFAWLRRRAGVTAAAVVFLLLEFAPRMVSLGAQNRSYTLALFFVLATLYTLDRAIDEAIGGSGEATGDGVDNAIARRASVARFALAGLCWSLAAASDYSVALLCPALAAYAALRLWTGDAPWRGWCALAGCLVPVLAVYGFLYVVQLRPLLAEVDPGEKWLRAGFPGEDVLFPVRATSWQFLYFQGDGMSQSSWYAAPCVVAFLLSLAMHRAWWPLAVLPFVTGLAAAYTGFFPYAGRRHTMLLGLPIALMLALLAARAISRLPVRPAIVLAAMLPLLSLWLILARRDEWDLPRVLLVPSECRQAARFVAEKVPKMQPMLLSMEAYNWMRYYLAAEGDFAPALIKTRSWQFDTEPNLRQSVNALRAAAGMGREERVWVAEGVLDALGPRLRLETGPPRGGIYVYPLPADY